jgi:Xaa-Pro aminopeptidase
MSVVPSEERERRHAALQCLLEDRSLDVLVLASNDYRGHKGALRWVADYNLVHRYGYAVIVSGREPQLVLPYNLAMAPRSGFDLPASYPRNTASGLCDAIAEAPSHERIGIVGLRAPMRVEDYLELRERFPHSEVVDASDDFEQVRAVKSPYELTAVREASDIAERCFARLLEIVEPGVTERSVAAEMYRTSYALGGEDPLFLSMYGVPGEDGAVSGRFEPPGARILGYGDTFTFSFELIGPRGYWMEFARMVALGRADELATRMNAAVADGMAAAAAAMRPGARPDEVQRAALDAIERHGAKSTYWSGHGLGADVIEEPWLGLEVVQDRDVRSPWQLAEHMVLAMHPYVADAAGAAVGYMANSYVVTPGGGTAVSDVPLDLYVV